MNVMSEPKKSTSPVHLNVKPYGQGDQHFLGIPGFGATHGKSFGNMLERLPEHVTFHGMDPPGLGESPLPTKWTWQQITNHMIESVDHIVDSTGEPITLVGACSGSFHAMEVAKQRPDAIKELILLEPFGYTPWFLRVFLVPKLGYGVFHSLFGTPQGRGAISKGLAMAGVMSEYNPIASFANVPSKTVHNYLSLYYEIEQRGPDYFDDLSMTKRVLHGTKTFGAVKDSLPTWHRIWDDVSIITIADVGHQLTQDKPQEVNDIIFSPKDK